MKISSEKRCDSYNFLDKSTAVQIPVDACPTFVLKRRSFSFVIDIKVFTITAKTFFLLPNGFLPFANAIDALHSNRYYVHFVHYKSAWVYQVATVEHQNSTEYFLHFHSFRCKSARSHSTVILPRRRMPEQQRKRVRQERPLVHPRRN